MSDALSLRLPDWRVAPAKRRIPRPPAPKSKIWLAIALFTIYGTVADFLDRHWIDVGIDVLYLAGAWRWGWRGTPFYWTMGRDDELGRFLQVGIKPPRWPDKWDWSYLVMNLFALVVLIILSWVELAVWVIGAIS